MFVTRKKHLWTVAILYGIIAMLAGVIVFTWQHGEPYLWSEDDALVTTPMPDENYLQTEEVVVIASSTNQTETQIILPIEKVLFEYVEVKDSCGVHFEGECVLARSAPSVTSEVVQRLRDHVVLKVGGKVENENMTWYKIVFDEFIRYPERITSDWYVSAQYVDVLLDEGDKVLWEDESTTTEKYIEVNRAEQKLYAFDGDTPFMEVPISTGRELTPTPRGTFTVFKKTPSRYMQGPLPGFDDYYDLPGVPWNLYFTHEGAVIHGAYWHDSFGIRYSHGCVNLSPSDARKLYVWADLGTKVIVR